MRITVFGATGHVGQLFIQKALAGGHSIVAYARHSKKITATHPNLSVVVGELSDADKLYAAIEGSDVVVSVMGPVGYQNTFIFAPAYRIIIAAMQAHGVRRLIALGTPTIPDPCDRFNIVFWTLTQVVHYIIQKGHNDIKEVGTLVRSSDLDWTLVRVPLLTSGRAKNRIVTGAFGAGIWWPFITRADFVDFLIKQLTDHTYIRAAPAISN